MPLDDQAFCLTQLLALSNTLAKKQIISANIIFIIAVMNLDWIAIAGHQVAENCLELSDKKLHAKHSKFLKVDFYIQLLLSYWNCSYLNTTLCQNASPEGI